MSVSIVSQLMAATSCHSIVLTGELQAGDHFEKVIGRELVFRLKPMGRDGDLHGWQISLAPSHDPDSDYIYPINPPLRFNGLQTLGPGYGDETKTSLANPHKMRFLLDRADYDRILPLLENALWPYSAPHPDNAGDEYLGALKTLSAGLLTFTVRSYAANPLSGSVRRISFQAVFTAPRSFGFDRALNPKPAECPNFSE